MKKNLVIIALMSIALNIWATSIQSLSPITSIETAKNVKSDFKLPSHSLKI